LKDIKVEKIRFINGDFRSLNKIEKYLNGSSIINLCFDSCNFSGKIGSVNADFNNLLKNCNGLKVLKFKACDITDEHMESFNLGLSENKSIKFLNMSGNLITKEGILEFFKCFEKNNTIEKLNLKKNKLDFDDAVTETLEDLVSKREIELNLLAD